MARSRSAPAGRHEDVEVNMSQQQTKTICMFGIKTHKLQH